MSVQDLLAKLDGEISRLRQARALLLPLSEGSPRGTDRPKDTLKRQLTAEGKQRIRGAQKARWAARKFETAPKPLTEEMTATEPSPEVLVQV